VNAVQSPDDDLHVRSLLEFALSRPECAGSTRKSKGRFHADVHQQNQYGGSVGTPIIKDKLFFSARMTVSESEPDSLHFDAVTGGLHCRWHPGAFVARRPYRLLNANNARPHSDGIAGAFHAT